MATADLFPFDEVIELLRRRARRSSGVEGAIAGAALGLSATVVAAHRNGSRLTAGRLAAAAAIGMAYGAAETTPEENLDVFDR